MKIKTQIFLANFASLVAIAGLLFYLFVLKHE